MRAPTWIQTASGRQFFPLEPDPMAIMLDDVAHALSNCCRFTGATREFYSVAQHCVLASRAIRALDEAEVSDGAWIGYPRLERAALLHDASEAYLVDVPAPIKPHLHGYAEIEARVMAAVAQKFCVPFGDLSHPLVKRIDLIMLATEKRDLLGPEPASWGDLPAPLNERITAWTPRQAKAMFLARWAELAGAPIMDASQR